MIRAPRMRPITRLRLALIGLAIAVAAPTVSIVVRALESVRLEESLRQRTVADRAFVEMERRLSQLLDAEQTRRFEDYRFWRADPRSGRGIRSPLSRPSPIPFVVGHFQIDPDGSLHTPLVPRADEPSPGRPRFEIGPELEERILRIGRSVASASTRGTPGLAQSPATHIPSLHVQISVREEASGDEQDGERPHPAASAFEILAHFNRAALERLASRPAQEALDEEEGDAQTDEPEAPALFLSPLLGLLREPEPAPLLPRPTPGLPPVARAAAVVGLEGELDTLVLMRSVSVDGRTYRQGVVLDRPELYSWLSEQVLEPGGLAERARLTDWQSGAPAPELRDGEIGYRHRFGGPFSLMEGMLSLQPLDGGESVQAIYNLVGLLGFAALVGLIAVYRMVSVELEFADRRNNFVASVSHELKTPLTAIRMYGEMLRDGLVSSEAKRGEYYGTITDESERLTRLIDNVLEFSQLERGTRLASLERGSLGALVEDAAARLVPHAKRRGFELRIDIEPELPAVRLDRDAVVQVVFNLVDNAIKYAENAEHKEIVLECRAIEDAVELRVRDFGPGVAAENLSRIFEPFYRGGDEMTRSTQGTGIGLALVKELADRMGAIVSGKNADGGGFAVRILFPRAEVNAPSGNA